MYSRDVCVVFFPTVIEESLYFKGREMIHLKQAVKGQRVKSTTPTPRPVHMLTSELWLSREDKGKTLQHCSLFNKSQ